MATIGSLAVNVVANSGGLVRGMTQGRTAVKAFAATAGAALAGVGAATAIATKAWHDVAPQIDEVGKASDRLNVATERLSALGHAGNLAGVSSELLTGSMTKMLNIIGDGAMGVTSSAAAFERLGLSADRLKTLKTDEAFLQIADAINKLPTAADKTTAAMDIFGRSGANLLPLLNSGRAGIEAMMTDAEKLGVTYTREQSRMVEAANDAMTRVGAAIDGLKMKLVIALAPAVERTANAFADLIASMGGAAASSSTAAQNVSSGWTMAADVIHTLKLGFLGARAAVTSLISFAVSGIEKLASTATKILNKLPGVDIGEPQFAATLADEMRRNAEQTQAEFKAAFLDKTPSERMQILADRTNDVAAAATKAADAIESIGASKVEPPPALTAFMDAISGDKIEAFAQRAIGAIGRGMMELPNLIGGAAGALGQSAAGLFGSVASLGTQHLPVVERGTLEGWQAERRIGKYAPGGGGKGTPAEYGKEQVSLLSQLVDLAKQAGGRVVTGGVGAAGALTVNVHNIPQAIRMDVQKKLAEEISSAIVLSMAELRPRLAVKHGVTEQAVALATCHAMLLAACEALHRGSGMSVDRCHELYRELESDVECAFQDAQDDG